MQDLAFATVRHLCTPLTMISESYHLYAQELFKEVLETFGLQVSQVTTHRGHQ